MNEMENSTSTQLLSEEITRKDAKRKAWITTILYILFSPIYIGISSFNFAMIGIHFMSDGIINKIIGGLNTLIFFSVPLSLPIGLYLVWSNYLRSNFRKSQDYRYFPVLILVASIVISLIVAGIGSFFK